MAALTEQVQHLLNDRFSDYGSASERDDEFSVSSDGGSAASVNSVNSQHYCKFDGATSKHFGADKLAKSGKYKPERFDMFGEQTWMSLTKQGQDTKGNIALAHSYASPLALFCDVNHVAVENLLEQCQETGGYVDFGELLALRNNLRETHNLANRYRTLIAEKAKVLRPGATEYEKHQYAYIERVCDEMDFVEADAAPTIARLRKSFARSSQKEELKRLSAKAAKGGGGGYGGGYGGSESDDSNGWQRAKSRSKSRRERARSAKERGERESSRGREQRKPLRAPRDNKRDTRSTSPRDTKIRDRARDEGARRDKDRGQRGGGGDRRDGGRRDDGRHREGGDRHDRRGGDGRRDPKSSRRQSDDRRGGGGGSRKQRREKDTSESDFSDSGFD